MLEHISQEDLFIDYYSQWVKVYKEGAIRKVTLDKYHMTCSWLEKLIPNLKLKDMTRINYQQLLNDYAEKGELPFKGPCNPPDEIEQEILMTTIQNGSIGPEICDMMRC